MLDLVDGVGGVGRCRPRQQRGTGVPCRGLERLVVRHTTSRGTHQIQHIERRHTRPRLVHIQSRIRDAQPLRRGVCGEPKQLSLAAHAVVLCVQIWTERQPECIKQERVFTRLLRKHALGESWDIDHPEGTTARLCRCPHEHSAVAPTRWLGINRQQSRREHATHGIERDGPNSSERSQFAKDSQHAGRPPQNARGQICEPG